MNVVKRDGRTETVMFDKIVSRISKLAYSLDPTISPVVVAQKVTRRAHLRLQPAQEHRQELLVGHGHCTRCPAAPQRHTWRLLFAHPPLAHLFIPSALAQYVNPRNGQPAPLISDEVHEIIMANADKLDAAIIYDRDFEYDYFGFKTLEKSYLLKMHGKIVGAAAAHAHARLDRHPQGRPRRLRSRRTTSCRTSASSRMRRRRCSTRARRARRCRRASCSR